MRALASIMDLLYIPLSLDCSFQFLILHFSCPEIHNPFINVDYLLSTGGQNIRPPYATRINVVSLPQDYECVILRTGSQGSTWVLHAGCHNSIPQEPICRIWSPASHRELIQTQETWFQGEPVTLFPVSFISSPPSLLRIPHFQAQVCFKPQSLYWRSGIAYAALIKYKVNL